MNNLPDLKTAFTFSLEEQLKLNILTRGVDNMTVEDLRKCLKGLIQQDMVKQKILNQFLKGSV